MDYKAIRKSFVKQQDQSDCGVACLTSIINFYGGRETPEKLRELSGTSTQGTTLLGLYNAASYCGLIAQGLRTDFEYLNKITNPVILHARIRNKYNHFVICYGCKKNKYIIGNPASGIEKYTHEEIDKIWQSKALLKLEPGDDFRLKEQVRSRKILWFKEIIKKDINILSASLFLGIIISILGTVIAIFSQKLIDDILPGYRKEDLITGLILVIFLLIIRAGLSCIQRYFGIKQSRDFNLRITGSFFSGLLRLPKPFFDNRLTGDLVARLNDTKIIQQTVIYICNSVVLNLFILVISGILIFLYSVSSGIITFSSIPVYFLISWLFHGKIVSGQRAVMEAHSRKESNYIDTIQGIDIIKSTNREDFFSDINKVVYGFYQETIFKLGRVNISLAYVTEITGVIFTIILLSVNSFMVMDKTITVGVFTAILGIASPVLPVIASLAFANIQLQGARIAFDRMFEYTGLRKEYNMESGNKAPLKEISKLTFENLSFSFTGRRKLLTDISFSISKGEMITLFGESGCGKSTIINLLQRYYYPEKGKFLINNTDASKYHIGELRRFIAVVPQKIRFFNGTVIENICMDNNEKEIQNALIFCKKFGFDRYFRELPLGYYTMLGEEGVNISGGQQQLISFARALYRYPQVLLLDEPTSLMDREIEEFTLNLLKGYKPCSMIIMVTHRISSAKFSDRIYIINNGEIEVTGTHKELIAAKNIYSMTYHTIV